jgi:hypothetical protein
MQHLTKHQPNRPPAAQLLYDLGLEADGTLISEIGPKSTIDIAPYPPAPHTLVEKHKGAVPSWCLHEPLPF